jgi:hypothetical protein
MTADAGRADAPMPPTRPVEFASLQLSGAITTATRSLAPIGDAQGKNDQIAALLARKLPSVITKGAGGAVPQGALALAEVGAPEPPERPATLARAAALSASLPPAGAAALSSPLARAAQLSAPLPGRHTPKAVLVAARIDRADFTVMTAAPAKGQNASSAGARIVPVAPNARSDELTAMLTPKAQAPGAFVSQPYGDLRSDAFTGPAVKPLDEAMAASEAAPSLRGSSD